MTAAQPVDLEVAYEGQLAVYDCRVLTLAVLKGLLDSVTDEPVSFVNAPQVARDRGLALREAKSSEARDYVNLISLQGTVGGQEHLIAGTLSGTRQEPRIVNIDGHLCDIPPARFMVVVRNSDRPGQIGLVGTVLGRAGVNISDMNLGRSPSGEAALMVIATDSAVPAGVVAELQAEPGIVSARAIALP
jgi:D-3-phosphoglycerate dehydrogenase